MRLDVIIRAFYSNLAEVSELLTQKPYINNNVYEKYFSPAGNRTPVSRVTGGDTNHYTTEDY